MKRLFGFFIALAFIFASANMAGAVPQYIEAPPLAQVITTPVGEVAPAGPVRVPLITWGGDIATILGNGNARATAKGSIFEKEGLNIQLFREDDFKKQVEMYLRGETPYLRGTLGMINMALEIASRDPRTTPLVIFQETESRGGDALVVKEYIKTAKDLCGKTVAIQAYGPHVDYMVKVITDACGSMDVKIKWTKDLTGDLKNTTTIPGHAFLFDKIVDAAFVIIPDANALTSGGKVGTGSENSVKGARILFSTATANRTIADVYVVRSDYFERNRKEIEKFTHAYLLAEEALGNLAKSKDSRYKQTFTVSAEILLDSKEAFADAEGLFAGAEFMGYRGNVLFFGDPNYPRNFQKRTSEIQTAFISLGLMSKKVSLDHAKWDYNVFKAGLVNTESVIAPKFDRAEVARIVTKKQQENKLSEGDLGLGDEVYFKPNQTTFVTDEYRNKFDVVIERAATYGGAIITVEGHSDPQNYWIQRKADVPEMVLTRIKQKAKNDSHERAEAVQNALIAYAKSKGIKLNTTQFIIIGHGITKPKSGRICGDVGCRPQSEEEFYKNMRVEFRVVSIESESTGFVKEQ